MSILVVVVRSGGPRWAILAAVILVVMVVVAVVVLLLSRGTVLLVAIPGFPTESIVLGLVLGTLLLAIKRRKRVETRSESTV